MAEKELWLEFTHPLKLCGLCGNTGIIDTRRSVISPAGYRCGVRRYCICPNGRALLKRDDGKQIIGEDES